jgi:hypothetical protein
MGLYFMGLFIEDRLDGVQKNVEIIKRTYFIRDCKGHELARGGFNSPRTPVAGTLLCGLRWLFAVA